MQGRGERVQVAARVRAFGLDLFERRIVRRVAVNTLAGGELQRLFGQPFGQPEVEQNDLPLIGDLEILRLDVAMNDGRMLAVQISQCAKQLLAPLDDLVGVKRAAALFEHRHQVVAGDVLHDQELTVALGEMVADFRQRRVAQARQQSGLALEGFEHHLIGEEGLFEGDGVAEALIRSLIDRPHAALSEQPGDEITVLKQCVWSEHVSPLPLSRAIGLTEYKT